MASNPMSAEITVQYLLLRIIEWKSDREILLTIQAEVHNQNFFQVAYGNYLSSFPFFRSQDVFLRIIITELV